MIDTNQKIDDILLRAEAELRQLIAAAAGEGDYAGVEVLREYAVRVQQLRNNGEGRRVHRVDTSPSKPPERPTRKLSNHVRTSKAKSEYPKFEIRNDVMVKLGWSKRQKKEYRHKVPREAFEATLAAMGELTGEGGGPFLAETVFERVNKGRDEIIPSYQVYVVIAFLRHKGCIHQRGRDGYDIPGNIQSKAGTLWQ